MADLAMEVSLRRGFWLMPPMLLTGTARARPHAFYSLHRRPHYADDLATLTVHLDLKKAIHVGHSTGGGEVARYIARHGGNRVAAAAMLSAVPPLMMKTESNPGGLPKDVCHPPKGSWQA
jgi:pimeloyl-ACP methyl ester carboxylesterase